MASKGVVSGSGPSMMEEDGCLEDVGRLCDMYGCRMQ